MPTDELALPTATPSEVGVDAAGVLAFLDATAAAADLELHSIALLRHGQVCARGWWAPYGPDDATLMYSLSKSFTSTALGFAVAEGLVSLDDRVVDLLPVEEPVGARTADLRVRHLAAMATGHRTDLLQAIADAPDPALAFLAHEPEAEPGSVFLYNNPATYTLGTIVQRATGATLTDYLGPRLFAPLGVSPGWWDQVPPGRDVGFTGLHLTTEVLVRFGQLYANGGTYAGRAVLPDGWAELALSLHTPNPAEPNPDWQQGYGFQFWRGRHGSVRADGAYGQFVAMLPEQDAVLVLTGGTANMQGVLDAVWAHLLPAFDRPGSADADAELLARLDDLDLVTDRPDPLVEQPATTRLVAVDEQPDGWSLTLEERSRTYVLAAGDGSWRRTDLATEEGWGTRVAARGTRTAGEGTADRVTFDVVLVETPHRLRVETGPAGSSVTWHTAPLWEPSIASLATPRPAGER